MSSTLNTTLANYVTNTALNNKGYVTQSSLNSTLANYVTNTALNNKGYVTNSSLTTTLSNYVKLDATGLGNLVKNIWPDKSMPDDWPTHPFNTFTMTETVGIWKVNGYAWGIFIPGSTSNRKNIYINNTVYATGQSLDKGGGPRIWPVKPDDTIELTATTQSFILTPCIFETKRGTNLATKTK